MVVHHVKLGKNKVPVQNTREDIYLIRVKVTQGLHWDGFKWGLPAELQGHHLVTALLKRTHDFLVLIQSLVLVLKTKEF